MAGEHINHEQILKIEEKNEGFVVYCVSAAFFLPKDSKNICTKTVYEAISVIEKESEKIKLTVEKLLSVGDSLILNHVLYYRSKNGMALLYPKPVDCFDYKYTCPKENFSAIDQGNNILIEHSEEYANGCIYIAEAASGKIKRYDYRYLALKALF